MDPQNVTTPEQPLWSFVACERFLHLINPARQATRQLLIVSFATNAAEPCHVQGDTGILSTLLRQGYQIAKLDFTRPLDFHHEVEFVPSNSPQRQ